MDVFRNAVFLDSIRALRAIPANEICAISELSMPPIKTKGGHYIVTIDIREADDWKIRMAYVN
jgi:hypothetical protein